MACRCKMRELYPLRPAMERQERTLTHDELSNMRLRRGDRPIRI